jgi:hypothetical protein
MRPAAAVQAARWLNFENEHIMPLTRSLKDLVKFRIEPDIPVHASGSPSGAINGSRAAIKGSRSSATTRQTRSKRTSS